MVVTAAPNTSVTGLPSGFVIVSVTPAIPGSPASCPPSRFVSTQTELPTLTFGTTKPKSRVVSLVPSTVKFVEVASPVLESVVEVPWPDCVAIYPAGSMAETLYEPTGRFSNRYAPLALVVVVVTALPNTSVTAEPSAFVIVNVTPAIPNSPASCTPSRSVSAHTKLPTLTFGNTKPKSRDVSVAPLVVKFVDVASPVLESVVEVP